MPKLKPDEIVASIIASDKALRETIKLHRALLKTYDADLEQERREFDERQGRLQATIAANEGYYAERVAKIDKRKEAVGAIIMKLEGELAEEIDMQDDGTAVVINEPRMIAHENFGSAPVKKNRFKRLIGASA